MFFSVGRFACALGLSIAFANSASSAEWPERPIKLIVTYPAGGSSDLPTRALADAINQKFGTKIVVENRAGAAGVVGLDACAKSQPDGYSFCTFVVPSMCILPSLRKTPFEIDQFVTVGRFVQLIQAFSTRADAKWMNLKELVEEAKAKPRQLKMGSSGVGTTQHLTEMALMDRTGIELTHIPYANSAEMITDTLGGRLDLIVESTAFQYYKAGKIRILAVGSPHPDYPELPVVEKIIPGLDIRPEFAVFAPKGTPADIVAKFSSMMNEAIEQPAVRTRFLEIGSTTMTDTPEGMKRAFGETCKTINGLVKKFNVKPE